MTASGSIVLKFFSHSFLEFWVTISFQEWDRTMMWMDHIFIPLPVAWHSLDRDFMSCPARDFSELGVEGYILGVLCISCMRKCWETWDCSDWKREDQERILSMLINFWRKDVEWMGPGSFCGTQQQDKFHLNLLPDRALDREILESPSLEIWKTHLDVFLCKLL